ncbi:hypothetical protein JCM10003_516 [Bacteroides pyogenes JCM 10003]|uniref:Uncharacterized protein n=1 Tax=Bacteroides pyogenes JCM 6292 TaxID=1235809 RepID=W4P528_9BACE|nr:hypothetical protein JCM6292_1091 [Bacteroides pyogenes JCM 6292]GAE21109.1 hypothetical protein JCM10003_516 [Bacteroides pyogenes JCM 10003]
MGGIPRKASEINEKTSFCYNFNKKLLIHVLYSMKITIFASDIKSESFGRMIFIGMSNLKLQSKC